MLIVGYTNTQRGHYREHYRHKTEGETETETTIPNLVLFILATANKEDTFHGQLANFQASQT